jgi:hypothetical protein
VYYLQNHWGVESGRNLNVRSHSTMTFSLLQSLVQVTYFKMQIDTSRMGEKIHLHQHSHSISCRAAARRVVSYTRVSFRCYTDSMLKIHCPNFMHSFIHIFLALRWKILDVIWVERMTKWRCTYLILSHLKFFRVPSLIHVMCK